MNRDEHHDEGVMPEEGYLHEALQQLKNALHSHEQWHREIIRSIACRLPCDKQDIQPDAHRHCRFGLWYYGMTMAGLEGQAKFASIEDEHRQMHAFAAYLLQTSEKTGHVTSADYDNFTNSVERLRLQLQSLINELEDALYKIDPLTGAENRLGMLPALRQEQALVARAGHACSVMIMDLDYFKAINDTHGHMVGDRVLAAVVRHGKAVLRPYDRIFRYGGEEFLLLLPNTEPRMAHIVAERIRVALVEQVLTHDEDLPITVTASFGLAELQPGMTVEDAIDHADRALYSAKEQGRNRVCVAEQDRVA